jgi:acetamidase/formamidase
MSSVPSRRHASEGSSAARKRPSRGDAPLDRKRMIGKFAPGIELPLRPFFGSMGVAPVDITQLVDGNVGVHALLPKKIFTGAAAP